jgi:Aerotolerance regulator N-terminal/von Willebrand factor type A domain
MAFLNPLFLGFLSLVGVPVLIHLIRRRKLRVVQWAAMEFLLQSQKKQRKRLRIEELILLALRMLIVAIAVLAFARPVLRAGIPLFSQNARVYAIIVLDNSYSMEHKGQDGRSAFERAKAAANTLLTKVLKDGDSVSIVLASDRPETLIGVPSYDIKAAARRVGSLKPGDRGTDLLASLQAVNRLLKASKSPVKEVYWLSDDQASAWETAGKDTAQSAWQEMSKQAMLIWTSCGAPAGERDNLAVEPPVLGRELVTPRLPARIESRILNFGTRSKDDLLVNLTLDGKPAGSVRVAVPAGGSATARFLPFVGAIGTHTGVISIANAENADGLSQDNAAPFVLRCRESIKVLLQDIHPQSDPARSESFYLLNAMAPGGSEESLSPKLREGPGLGTQPLRDYDVVVLAGASSISTADARALGDYVRGGGGLLLFPGSDTDAARLNADFTSAGLLPAKLGTRKQLTDETAITLNPAAMVHPALALFKDTSAIDISSARFTIYYPLEPANEDSQSDASRVIARFSNGDPALVERKVGMGHVILAASSAGAEWNQLALKPAYVPFVYQLVSYLGQGAVAHRNLRQDEPVFLTLPLKAANQPVKVTTPEGKAAVQNSVLDARGVTFNYSATSRAGLYKVALPDGTSDAFAVNLNTAESNIAMADPAEKLSKTGIASSRFNIAKSPDQIHSIVNRARYGVEIWRSFLWLLIPMLFLESLLAQRFGRRG